MVELLRKLMGEENQSVDCLINRIISPGDGFTCLVFEDDSPGCSYNESWEVYYLWGRMRENAD